MKTLPDRPLPNRCSPSNSKISSESQRGGAVPESKFSADKPIIASDWIGLVLKHVTQFLIIFRLVDLNARGQNSCLTADAVICVPACMLCICSRYIKRWVNSCFCGAVRDVARRKVALNFLVWPLPGIVWFCLWRETESAVCWNCGQERLCWRPCILQGMRFFEPSYMRCVERFTEWNENGRSGRPKGLASLEAVCYDETNLVQIWIFA